ncbi:MAG: S8 family peptidase [Casimicrobiaceae bacterium]
MCALCMAALAVSAQVADAQVAFAGAPARVIVKLKADSTVALAKASGGESRESTRAKILGRRVGLSMRGGSSLSDHTQVVFADGVTSRELAQRLAEERDVDFAVPDERRTFHAAPNDPLYASGQTGTTPPAGQWYVRAPEGETVSAVNAETAWTVTRGSPAIVVAVLDTGVRFEHPDILAVSAGGNLLPGYDMVSDIGTANDGDGRDADASDPGDWVSADDSTPCDDPPRNSSWHGTKTAGLIAALTNNGVGIASVGRAVRVLPVRVLGKCGGYDSDIIAGMRWAAALPVPRVPANAYRAAVINMSLGYAGGCSAAYQDAVTEIVAAGIVIVASAGNFAGHAVHAPANCRGVIAVAALRHTGTKVGFSNLGPEIVVSAPGGNCVNTAAGAPCLYPIVTTSNSGATTPADSVYTDAVVPSLGTSFAAPLVAGTAALMLSAQPGMTPERVARVIRSTARPFPAGGDEESIGAPGKCVAPYFDQSGPVDQLECHCATSTCGAGMLDAGAAVLAAAGAIDPDFDVEGPWWNAPAGSESGWGLNVAQQGGIVFATWFTYDDAGAPLWLSMTGMKLSPNAYTGTLYRTRGPAFNAEPFDPARVTRAAVGNATLTFTDSQHGTFSYRVGSVAQTRAITRMMFGALPVCRSGAHPGFATATNYQDIWWNAPPESESGWGISLAHQGNIIFATWFTYDAAGNPRWLSATVNSVGLRTYAGTLYRSSGPPFSAVTFDPARVKLVAVGEARLEFADGNAATFSYVVDGVAQTKMITRQVFRAPGTLCQ